MLTGIEFKLEVFSGPLELMISLISKHKLNIRDIEISILLEQFLAYIEKAGEHDIELAGEFLEAAARLIYIKTSALLPKHEAEKLKAELEGALIEYALCKITAERLREQYVGDIVFTHKPLEQEIDLTYTISHEITELVDALCNVSDRGQLRKLLAQPPEEEDVNPALVVDYVSIFSKIIHVLKRVRKKERVEIKPLFVGLERSSKVATFMALLELSSHGRIVFSEDSQYIEMRPLEETHKTSEKLQEREVVMV